MNYFSLSQKLFAVFYVRSVAKILKHVLQSVALIFFKKEDTCFEKW